MFVGFGCSKFVRMYAPAIPPSANGWVGRSARGGSSSMQREEGRHGRYCNRQVLSRIGDWLQQLSGKNASSLSDRPTSTHFDFKDAGFPLPKQ